MNEFSESQLEVIDDLAGFYWDKAVSLNMPKMPEESREKMRKNFINNITQGLTNSMYWDLDI